MIFSLIAGLFLSTPLPTINPVAPSAKVEKKVFASHWEETPSPSLKELPNLQCTSENRPYVKPDIFALYIEDGPTNSEALLVEEAIDNCGQTNRRVADPYKVLALLRLEKDLHLPEGILISTFCIEASMRTETAMRKPIRGDWLNQQARAYGPFQLHGWFRDWCGLNSGGADDLITAARCYASRIVHLYPQAQKLCGARAWSMAEAMTANAPKYNWGIGYKDPCSVQSKHWKQALKLPIPR